VCFLRSVQLALSLGHEPAPRSAIDREDRPSVAVLVAEMYKDRVAVVFDA